MVAAMLREVLLRFRELDNLAIRARVTELLAPGLLPSECLACLRDPSTSLADWCVSGICAHDDPMDVHSVLTGGLDADAPVVVDKGPRCCRY